MKERKVHSKNRYFYAMIIAIIIFILVFSFSYFVSYIEFQRNSNYQNNFAYDIFENKLVLSLFEKEGICSQQSLDRISQDLALRGSIIDNLEKKFGKNNKNVLFQKKFYTLMELEHFEFIKTQSEDCNLDINTIFFFYSNEKSDIDSGETLGNLLSVISSRNKDLIIYSFDINLDSNLIDLLKKEYNINNPSTIVVNEEIVLINPTNIDEIEQYLN